LVVFLAALVAVLVPAPLIPAQEAARTLSCKSWPAGYFLTEDSRKPAQWKRLLRLLERELAGLNARGECLVVKGTIIEPLETTRRYYDTITILDESGLKVVVRRMPNLYYRYPGLLGPMHKNVFLVARNLRLQEADSRLTGSFLVAGDFVAYASKYLEALGKYWGNGAPSEKEDD
jgi:hypothetical protein